MVYKTALRNLPDGKAHHAFNTKQIPKKKQGGSGAEPEEHKAKFSRLTHSTLLRFITGHTFIGEYTKRFYPPHTQEQLPARVANPYKRLSTCS